jgi:ADP-heptose:LPS heptosyltransferase
MGWGDQVIATSFARGAAARGKRIAFGDGQRIIWDWNSPAVFQNNPNIAPPGSEKAKDIEWVGYYKKSRLYNTSASFGKGRWVFNYDFRVRPGEFFFDAQEDAGPHDSDLILIEPNTPAKPCAPNKQWPVDRWKKVANELRAAGFNVRQFEHGRHNRGVAPALPTLSFRHAAAQLKRARLAILPEGGLHHAAAAVGCPAVVLFGGYVPPAILGYDWHINLTGSAEACGSFNRCQHCVDAMNRITVNDVLDACERML